MRTMRPIPMRLLPSMAEVREQLADGTFGEPKTIHHVRFERMQLASTDAHRRDSICGLVFIDAVMSKGAYAVPAGSRIEIGSESLFVESCTSYMSENGHMHHWELEVR